MPPILIAVAAVVVDLAVTSAVTGAIIAGVTISAAAAAVIGGIAAMGVQLLATALLAPAQRRTFSVRDPISSHKVIVGQMKVGGALTFIDTTTDNKSLFLVITLSGHPLQSIDALYVNDTYVPLTNAGWARQAVDWPDGTKPTNYTNHLQAYYGLGTVAGDAGLIAALQAQSPKWGPNFFQYGRGKIYVRLGWNDNLFGSTGVPNIACVVSGRMVYDPRHAGTAIATSTADGTFSTAAAHGLVPGNMVFIKNHSVAKPANPQPFWAAAQRNAVAQEYEVANVTPLTFQLYDPSHNILTLSVGGSGGTVTKMTWSDNSALTTMDYLVEPVHGMGVIYASEVDENLLIANANLCDETVPRVLPSTTFTANATTSQITYVENLASGSIPALCQLVFSSTGTLPAGINANTVYYWAQIGGGPTGGLSLSSKDAAAQPPRCIHISGTGSGIHTMTVVESLTPDTNYNTLNVYNNALRITTGSQVVLNNFNGRVPGGLIAGQTYWGIFVSDTVIQFATSLENARQRIPVVFTDRGTGTSFVTVLAEPRYTANGQIDTASNRQANIQKLLTSMGGYLVPNGVLLNVYPAQYRTPLVTLSESDLRGPIRLTALQSGQSSFNSVKGTFVDPFNKGQPTDYPQIQNQTYIAQDQYEVIWRDVTLDFTNSSSMAQRLAKIELERARRELSVQMPLKLTAFQVGAPDTILVNNAMWGWAGEQFEVQSWQFSIGGSAEIGQTLDVDINARQTDPAVYAWTAAEEAAAKRQNNTNLPNPFVVQPPSLMTLASGGAYIVQQQDGTVVSRILVSWVSPVDQFVLDGGFIEITYQISGSNNWQSAATVPGDQTFGFIENGQIGATYDIAIRARNAIGGVSDTDRPWQNTITSYVVQGKTGAPSDVPFLSVSENGMTVILAGGPIPDTDVVVYEYRYGGSQSWDTMTLIEQAAAVPNGSGGVAGGCTTGKIPAGNWWFAVKARNRTGIYSVHSATAISTVTNAIDGTSNILPGTINTGSFAQNISPILVYDVLPNVGAPNQVAVLSTDNQLYRWTGSAWTAAVPAVNITGLLTADQIASLSAAKISGLITPAQIQAINATQVAGQLTSDQIASIASAKIAGMISSDQILSLVAAKVGPGLTASQIDSINATALIGQIVDAQVAGITAGKITGLLTSAQIANIDAAKIAGQLSDSQIAGLSAAKLTGQITGTQITNGAISTPQLATGAVTALNIYGGTITGDKIAGSTIVAGNIKSGAVTSDAILAGAVIAGKLDVGAVQAGNISAGAVQAGNLAANSVIAGNVAAKAIQVGNLAAGSVITESILAGNVTGDRIAGGTITADNLASRSIIAGKIDVGGVVAGNIAALAVQVGNLAAGAVTAESIASFAVTAGKVNAGAIVAGNLAANSVLAGNLAANSIIADNIQAGAVTLGKLAAGSVQATNIVSSSLTSTQILGGSILADSLDVVGVRAAVLIANSIQAGMIGAGAINAQSIIVSNLIVTGHLTSNAVTEPASFSNTGTTRAFGPINAIVSNSYGSAYGGYSVTFNYLGSLTRDGGSSGFFTARVYRYNVSLGGAPVFVSGSNFGVGGSGAPAVMLIGCGGQDVIPSDGYTYLYGVQISASDNSGITTNGNFLQVTILKR